MTGVLFDDQNLNGVRDAGEPGLPGLKVHGTKDVVTDAEGRYTITGVALNSTEQVWLPIAAEGGEVTLSKPADAPEDVSWITGWVFIKVGTDPNVTHDFGYGRWGADQSVGFTFENTTGHPSEPDKIQVGDKINLDVETSTGSAPGYGGVLLTVPVGMHIVRRQMSPDMAYDWIDSRHARAFGLHYQDPKSIRWHGFAVIADKPTTGKITVAVVHDQHTDTNPRNNGDDMDVTVKAKPVRQVVAPVHNSTSGTPQASSSKVLAQTGVAPKPYLAAGVGLLGIGAALVGVARRKPRVTEASKS